MATSVPVAVRSSIGVSVYQGPPSFESVGAFTPVISKACRCMVFSPDGDYLLYTNGQSLHVVRTDSWKDVAVVEGTKPYEIEFSPKCTYFVTYESFAITKVNPQGLPNLNVYRTATGELVKNFVHKKLGTWEPRWTSDEQIFARISNTDVTFYESENFDRVANRISAHKVLSFSISPAVGTTFVLCHVAGGPGQPSFGKLFKYPNLEAPITNRSFFQADSATCYWNATGSHALFLTSTAIDKSDGCYYGKQGLHFFTTAGECGPVPLSKEGSVYSVAWSPKGKEFCVIYGSMPSKTTIFNLKMESVFELAGEPRNSIYYNPQGNLLLLAGFGNLPGNIEMWDTNNRRLICKCNARDTTLLEWSPDGVHFMTATTAPRLRIDNGYKIWHYSLALLYERPWSQQDELYEVCWQPFPKGVFKEPRITSEKVEGIASSQPQASAEVYRPPSARNRPLSVGFMLHPGQPPVKPGGGPSKAALKQRKKRENRKTRKQEEEGDEVCQPETNGTNVVGTTSVQVELTGDPEKDKRIKTIKKKLDAISKLKAEQASGKTLEKNQVEKIQGEKQLVGELRKLEL